MSLNPILKYSCAGSEAKRCPIGVARLFSFYMALVLRFHLMINGATGLILNIF
jgi:hypothetical protein